MSSCQPSSCLQNSDRFGPKAPFAQCITSLHTPVSFQETPEVACPCHSSMCSVGTAEILGSQSPQQRPWFAKCPMRIVDIARGLYLCSNPQPVAETCRFHRYKRLVSVMVTRYFCPLSGLVTWPSSSSSYRELLFGIGDLSDQCPEPVIVSL